MPRTCSVCLSSERAAIDKAVVAQESLRNISERFAISPAALCRHKEHLAQTLVRAVERKEERREMNLLEEAQRIRLKAWQLLDRFEAEGDLRGCVVALREVRETLDSYGELLNRAGDVCLVDATDNEILLEARRRGLKLPVTVTVVHDRRVRGDPAPKDANPGTSQ